mgnify:CR=1 FL=1
MSYATCHQTFTHKVRDYDAGTCQRALFDCHDTLKIWGDEIDSDYAVEQGPLAGWLRPTLTPQRCNGLTFQARWTKAASTNTGCKNIDHLLRSAWWFGRANQKQTKPMSS